MGEEDKVELKEVYPVHERVRKISYIKSREEYEKLQQQFLADPPGWWAKMADEYVTFFKKWDRVEDFNFDIRKGPIYVKYFEGAQLNVSYNCLDRHLEKRGDKVAIQWEGNEPGEERAITYRELHKEVCKFANVLKAHGVKKGDRVCIYMPMVPEAGIAMLACARIGAVHSVVFGGFSSDALSVRIRDSQGEDPRRLRRDLPRRQGGAPEEGRRHGPEGLPLHREGDRREAGRRQDRQTGLDAGPRSLVARGDGQGRAISASPSGWTPRIPSSSSTPPAPQASPRGPSTRRPAISSLRPTPTNWVSIFTRMTSGGAPPTSAG